MNGIPILMYHRVPKDPDQRGAMSVPLVDFAAQMAYLAQHAIAVLSLEEFVSSHPARRSQRRPVVVLTFDDGYATTCDLVEAVLDRYGYPATLFLATGAIGRKDPFASHAEGTLLWPQVRALRRLRVQAHTVNHPRLSSLDRNCMRHEVRACKSILEQETSRKVDLFAYPFGGYVAMVREEVRAAGYAAACTVRRGPATFADDPWQLHRITVDGRDSLEVFGRKVQTGFGSVGERAVTGVRDYMTRLPGVHDLVERYTLRRWPALEEGTAPARRAR